MTSAELQQQQLEGAWNHLATAQEYIDDNLTQCEDLSTDDMLTNILTALAQINIAVRDLESYSDGIQGRIRPQGE